MRRLLAFMALAVLASGGCAWTGGQAAAADELTVAVSARPAVPTVGETVHWLLEVRNHGEEPVTLLFRDTQRGDVTLAVDGVHLYRWAERRAFSNQADEQVVPAGGSVLFTLRDASLTVAPGEYDLLGTLASIPAPAAAHGTVTVQDRRP